MNIEQFFETVVIIFEIVLSVVNDCGVEGLRNIQDLLTSVGFEKLHALLLVLFPFDDALAVLFKLV